MKKSQKVSSKIEFIGTYPNSLEFLEGALGPLGVKVSFKSSLNYSLNYE